MVAKRSDISATLLDWYDSNARVLPWRARPGEVADPYRVWLSEVMLQQTTVAAVRPRFEAWVARWPSVDALAAADEAAVMAAWAGLGYYARARNLVRTARLVVERGGFPRDEVGLRELPGLGAYTAAAISASAFGDRAVGVDANVERVAARLFAISDKRDVRSAADAVTPDARAGDFAQAMMDLGATICTPRGPRCLLCPLRALCAGFASGAPEAFPARKAKAEKPQRYGTVFWLERLPQFVCPELAEGPPISSRTDRDSANPPPPGGDGTRSVTEGADAERELAAALPLRAADAAHLPLAGEDSRSSSGKSISSNVEGRGRASTSSARTGEGICPGTEVLLVRRPARGLLGGMRALPTGPWSGSPPGLADAPAAIDWRLLDTTITHTFTHFRLELALAVGSTEAQSAAVEGEYWPVDRLEEAGLPTVFAKATDAIRRMA